MRLRRQRRTVPSPEPGASDRYRALAQAAGDALVVADASGGITDWNPAAERLLGHRAADVVGQPLTVIVPERYRLRHRKGMERLAAGGRPRLLGRSVELSALHADGHEVPVELALGRFEHDGTVGYVANLHDLTQRKRHEEHLARYQAIVAASDQAIVSTELEGRVTSWNRGAQDLYGWTEEQALGRPLDGLVGGSPLPGVLSLVHVEAEEVEDRRVHRDGRPLDVGVAWSPILDLDGTPQGLVEISRDIGPRKRNEAELAAATQRFQVSFEHAPIGMALVALAAGRTGSLLDVNEALCRILRTTKDHLLTGRITDHVDPQEADLVGTAIGRLASGAARSDRREVQLRRADGTPLWAVARTQVLTDTEGRPDYAIIQVTDVTERRRAEEQLAFQALHDPLTGLGNRRLFEDRMTHALARARRSAGTTALLYLDLDRFKAVNDALGHDVGDQVLVSVGRRVQPLLRSSDTFARMGGDEFVLLLEDLSEPDEASRVADRIQAELERPADTTAGPVQVSVSIGIAHVRGDESPAALLGMADAAMYQAKAAGRARQRVFDRDVDRSFSDLSGLRAAYQEHRLVLEYDRVHDVVSGRVVGLEALLRFRTPSGRLVVPDVLLDQAEQAGLLEPLTAWAVAMACDDLAGWRLTHPALTVSVDVSAQQVEHEQLYRAVADAVLDRGVPSACLALELSEGRLPPSRTLQRLDRLGVQLGIDHLGTGRTPLAALRDLPLDFVKVDRSLVAAAVADPRSAALVSSVVSLAHELGLTVVGVGVEDQAQLDFLRIEGCELAQGPYWDLPVLAAEVSLQDPPGAPLP